MTLDKHVTSEGSLSVDMNAQLARFAGNFWSSNHSVVYWDAVDLNEKKLRRSCLLIIKITAVIKILSYSARIKAKPKPITVCLLLYCS